MPPRGVGLWFFPTVDFCGARLARGGIVVLLKEQRVTLRLRGTRRSLCLMRGSRCSMLGRQTAAIPSAEDQHCLAFKGDGPWEVESSGS